MKLTSFSTHSDGGRRNAFTLAEVLITLGIIGVVAAMTMPTLMNQTNGAQYRTAYKKALSAISQAVTLNVALDEWNFADATATSTGADDTSIYSMLNKRMNVVRKETAAVTGYTVSKSAGGNTHSGTLTIDGNYTLFFNDGIMFTFPQNSSACSNDSTRTIKLCKGFIDVNGIKPPNKEVKCDSGSGSTCEVKNPTDVYPVVFYDQTIVPNSAPARAVLYSK
ncbi:type II secretion system protein [bacterium]|nr:type II secretion system protein [bacterium]